MDEKKLKLKDKDRGFLEYDREDPEYRPVEERVGDFRAIEIPMGESAIRRQAARCMDCGVPFCHAAGSGCPLSNIMPEFNEHVYAGRWEEALAILSSTNPFPEFTGRICPAPCESACVLGINDDPVAICKIELAIIEKGWASGYVKPGPPAVRKDKKVAVLGSGPAGLACAEVLNKKGCRVTVYETDARAGGILRYGIPDFKLEKWVIDRRLRLMEEEGIIFECGIKGGEDVSRRYLRNRFDAIVIAGGARLPRELDVPGRELKGIHMAMDFLTRQNRRVSSETIEGPDISAKDKNVVVVGGGDTGSDCIGTARRQGAISVTQIEILPEPPPERSPSTPWPLWPMRLRTSSSHEEGADRRWSVSATAFTGAGGRVKQVHCKEVDWVRNGDTDRPEPKEKKSAGFALDAEMVLLAMGFTGPGGSSLIEQLDVRRNDRGFIIRDENCMTDRPGIFAAGDIWRGASLVVHAISDGIRCAEKVAEYLEISGEPRRI